ncbi:MAG: hypothetical protein H0V44_02120 [Planctomycetes bacterium]|nr:hypothetical protein [Planctomycetota bacterium]
MSPECTDIHERGYVVLERVYDERELTDIHAIMRDAWQRAGAPRPGGHFGFIMHPLFAAAPDMAAYVPRPRVIGLLAELFGEQPRLAHNGGLMSDVSRSFTPWHYHRSDACDDALVWDLARRDRPERITRVLANVYVDGSTPERGELLVSPRRFDDPLAPSDVDRDREWSCQEVVRCAPGSIVVFDQSLFHAARPARTDAPRRIFGGHYQGWSESPPHREDNAADLPGVSAALTAEPMLRALVRGVARRHSAS